MTKQTAITHYFATPVKKPRLEEDPITRDEEDILEDNRSVRLGLAARASSSSNVDNDGFDKDEMARAIEASTSSTTAQVSSARAETFVPSGREEDEKPSAAKPSAAKKAVSTFHMPSDLIPVDKIISKREDWRRLDDVKVPDGDVYDPSRHGPSLDSIMAEARRNMPEMEGYKDVVYFGVAKGGRSSAQSKAHRAEMRLQQHVSALASDITANLGRRQLVGYYTAVWFEVELGQSATDQDAAQAEIAFEEFNRVLGEKHGLLRWNIRDCGVSAGVNEHGVVGLYAVIFKAYQIRHQSFPYMGINRRLRNRECPILVCEYCLNLRLGPSSWIDIDGNFAKPSHSLACGDGASTVITDDGNLCYTMHTRWLLYDEDTYEDLKTLKAPKKSIEQEESDQEKLFQLPHTFGYNQRRSTSCAVAGCPLTSRLFCQHPVCKEISLKGRITKGLPFCKKHRKEHKEKYRRSNQG